MKKLKALVLGVIFGALIGTIVIYSRLPEKRWIIEGYAATTSVNANDFQISEEALDSAVEDLEAYSTVFFNHDHKKPVGRILKAELRDNMLWVRIEISRAEKVLWQHIKTGVLSKFSVGVKKRFSVMEYDPSVGERGVYIKLVKVTFIEVSIVTLPADKNARILEWREE